MFKGAELSQEIDQKELQAVGALITQVFSEFGIKGEVIGFQPGPVVTVYEFQPEPGIKQARILTLIDDIALALKVDSIFIFPVKGKRALGVQVPNRQRQTAYLRNILESDAFKMASSPLTMAMGLSIAGEPICADLCAMPHLLMAGATGAGKSVAINTMLTSVIAKSGPEDVRMILVDPKMLELSVYEGIPHLLMPVITDVERAAMALKWAVSEMERRYKIMQLLAVRNIASFNESWRGLSETEKEALRQEVGAVDDHGLPMILIVIDELADLMMMAPKEVENCIQRLAQKARASGIHMILATQRPSVDIITGVIKANLPCRIAFQVVSRHDSRTILDQVGAEKLLGKGDMLYMRPGTQRFERIQGALVSDQEVIQFVRQFQAQVDPAYRDDVIQWIEEELVKTQNPTGEPGETTDGDEPKWDEAVGIAETQGSISASFLQRRMKIGYNRAARIVEQMESMGLVEKGAGSKPRAWLGR
jgi:S-DNA-T family DNA segregation ATPase FtsK/SpoIIIE